MKKNITIVVLMLGLIIMLFISNKARNDAALDAEVHTKTVELCMACFIQCEEFEIPIPNYMGEQ